MSDDRVNAAIDLLLSLGFRVLAAEPGDPREQRVGLTPSQVAHRVGLTPATLSKRLAATASCPDFPRKRGPNGRTLTMTLTEPLEAYLRAPLSPGRRIIPAAPAFNPNLNA